MSVTLCKRLKPVGDATPKILPEKSLKLACGGLRKLSPFYIGCGGQLLRSILIEAYRSACASV